MCDPKTLSNLCDEIHKNPCGEYGPKFLRLCADIVEAFQKAHEYGIRFYLGQCFDISQGEPEATRLVAYDPNNVDIEEDIGDVVSITTGMDISLYIRARDAQSYINILKKCYPEQTK